jgi:hypothetical protein
MEAVCFSEILAATCSTASHNPEDHSQHLHCCENIKTHVHLVKVQLLCFELDLLFDVLTVAYIHSVESTLNPLTNY